MRMKVDFQEKGSYFFIAKVHDEIVYRSEFQQTEWEVFAVDVGDAVKFDFYKYDAIEPMYKYLGSGLVTQTQLFNDEKSIFPIHNYHASPLHFQLSELHLRTRPTFLDYIFGGYTLDLSIIIDFSRYNRPQLDPSSFHYVNNALHA